MRYLNLGTVSAQKSQAVYHALAERMRHDDEIILVTVSPAEPYACVGYHQMAGREIDREYCEQHHIPVGRRFVGGGAVYLDGGQVFWHLLLPRMQGTLEDLYHKVLQAPIETYREMGIACEFRPVNDLVVGPRKIGGTGASTMGEATVVVGSLLWDFNADLMAHILKVPSEKFRDKMIKSLDAYMTTIHRELAHPPSRDAVTQRLVQGFAANFSESVHPSTLTKAEEDFIDAKARKLFDPAFVYRGEAGLQNVGVKIRDGVFVREGVFKAPGGLLRMVYRVNEGRFEDVSLSGDFFMNPVESPALDDFQMALQGTPATCEEVADAARALMRSVEIAKVQVDDVVNAFRQGELGKPQVSRSGS